MILQLFSLLDRRIQLGFLGFAALIRFQRAEFFLSLAKAYSVKFDMDRRLLMCVSICTNFVSSFTIFITKPGIWRLSVHLSVSELQENCLTVSNTHVKSRQPNLKTIV